MLPSLPSDAWSKIAEYLPPTDIRALSQTNFFIFQTVITEDQFRRRVFVSAYEKRCLPWSKIYRRLSALQRPPVPKTASFTRVGRVGRARSPFANTASNLTGSAPHDGTHIIGTVIDNLLLYDANAGRLVGFPHGWSRDIGRQMSERCVMVGHGRVAVLYGTGAAIDSIQCFNVSDGTCTQRVAVKSHGLTACAAFSRGRMRRPVVAISAGEKGDHLALVQQSVVTLVRLEDGCVACRWDMSGNWKGFGSLVRGEDRGWCGGDGDGGERVVALLRCLVNYGNRGQEHEIIDVVHGSQWSTFFLDERDELVDVVVSTDRQWIGRRIVRDARRSIIWSTGPWDDGVSLNTPRELREDVGWTGGTFAEASCEFSVARGGREMRIGPIGMREVAGVEGDGRVSRIFYGDTGLLVGSLKGIRRISGFTFDWSAMSSDGRILLACCRFIGVVSVFDMDGGRCLRTLRCPESIRDICLVGQHWLVVIGISGMVFQVHFGCWCIASATTSTENTRFGDLTHFNRCEDLFGKWDALFGTKADVRARV